MDSPQNPKRTTLSASKIKTLSECSQKFWGKYVLKLPDKSNTGSLKGSICHVIFEVLGNPRHRHHFDSIMESQDVFASPAIRRLIKKHVLKADLNKNEHVDSIKEMIMAGLRYDFFGEKAGIPSESLSELEINLDVKEGDLDYKVIGYIDKEFIYADQGLAIIRDFKSSKKMFSKDEVESNLQAEIYSLAVKKLQKNIKKIRVEFLFLQFMTGANPEDGVIVIEGVTDDEHSAQEYILTEVQRVIDSFDEKSALADMARDKGFTKGFGGIIMCGKNVNFAGELKEDGKPKWHCPLKFPFEYYEVKDKNGKTLKTYSLDDADKIVYKEEEGEALFLSKYAGCPAWKKK